MSTPTRPPTPPAVIGLAMVAAVTALLAGAWLILAPWSLAYQPAGADLVDAGVHDLTVGIVLAAVGLLGTIAFAVALARALTPPAPAPTTADASGDDELLSLLAPLVAALGEDTHTDTRTLPTADSARRS